MNISDFKSVSIVHSETPDACFSANILSFWSNVLPFTKECIPYTQIDKPLDDSELQVYLNVIPKIPEGQTKFKQIIAVFTDVNLWNTLVSSIEDVKDLDKYKVNSLIFTPYSLTEFVINRLNPCLNQDLKGIIHLPYVDNLIIADDIDPSILDVITIENPEFSEDNLSLISDDVILLYYDYYKKCVEYNKDELTPLGVSYFKRFADKEKPVTIYVREKGVSHKVTLGTGNLK